VCFRFLLQILPSARPLRNPETVLALTSVQIGYLCGAAVRLSLEQLVPSAGTMSRFYW
jgi:hypothetical protein